MCWVETDVREGRRRDRDRGWCARSSETTTSSRVAAAARRIVDGVVGSHVSIGVHRGTAFVGEIGHVRRRTYAVTGTTTITAAAFGD